MSLGDILFYRPFPGDVTPSFETITREMQASVPSQPRIGRDNAMQFTGPGEETISIHGRMFPYIFGGLSTLDALRDALRAGKPMMLVMFSPNMTEESATIVPDQTYSGKKVGNYMLRSVKRQDYLYTSDGLPMKVDFTIELVLYGDDL